MAGTMKPLLLMCLLGVGIWLGTSLYDIASRSPASIEISPEEIQASIRQFEINTRFQATAEIISRRLEGLIRDKVLIQYARELALGEGDAIIESRITRNIGFLDGNETRNTRASFSSILDREMIDTMHRDDPLVNKRLLQIMEEGLLQSLPAKVFTDEEVAQYYRERPEEFPALQQFSFEHLYFKQASGPVDPASAKVLSAADRAERVLQTLKEQDLMTTPGIVEGDASLHGRKIENLPSHRASLLFGPEFLAQLTEVPEGRWSGVVHSAYGAHLVYMVQRKNAGVLPLEQVSEKVRIRLSNLRRDEYLADSVAKIRQHYNIIVPEEYAQYM